MGRVSRHTTMIRALAFIVVLCACASTSDGGGSEIDVPPDEVLLRIATLGGFVPREVALSEVPEVTVLGDGRLIVLSADQGLDGPLPEIVEYQLTAAGVEQVLDAAIAAGLDSPLADYGFPGVTDLPNTDFTLRIDGGERIASVYALGFDDPDEFGVTTQQSEARRALTDFRARVLDAVSWLGADITGPDPYRPPAIAVFVTGSVDDPPEGAAIETWPLGDLGAVPTDDTALFACKLAEGADVDMLYQAVEAASFGTLWSSGELLYYLGLRPLLPDELECPSGQR